MIKVRCPICDQVMQGQRAEEWPDLPFCSARCRLIDLGRWLGENYRVSTGKPETDIAESDDGNTNL
jgi:endogenous inhibitor of DNA gyrase (YacG/DUF329 family)